MGEGASNKLSDQGRQVRRLALEMAFVAAQFEVHQYLTPNGNVQNQTAKEDAPPRTVDAEGDPENPPQATGGHSKLLRAMRQDPASFDL
jgi:hypothetical protein